MKACFQLSKWPFSSGISIRFEYLSPPNYWRTSWITSLVEQITKMIHDDQIRVVTEKKTKKRLTSTSMVTWRGKTVPWHVRAVSCFCPSLSWFLKKNPDESLSCSSSGTAADQPETRRKHFQTSSQHVSGQKRLEEDADRRGNKGTWRLWKRQEGKRAGWSPERHSAVSAFRADQSQKNYIKK